MLLAALDLTAERADTGSDLSGARRTRAGLDPDDFRTDEGVCTEPPLADDALDGEWSASPVDPDATALPAPAAMHNPAPTVKAMVAIRGTRRLQVMIFPPTLVRTNSIQSLVVSVGASSATTVV
ncbi:hypothetical protein [Mycobacterium sp. shizuoka-1]|uniref:hypothetical protein n=1 Tax=Mycobacterium sp. shizuoka-1 TaxID=2039281 RepID=UPI000C06740C|nr:hypothetical protein [Mycobacterium sp. shizuoka-1]GAY15934.1 hypothetical protein MSZK_26600 [Mycobacterium sp. shizuoka-1]